MNYDNATLAAIVLASSSLVAIFLKLMHSLRNDVRKCCCIDFRTPRNTENNQTSTPQIIVPNDAKV